MSKKTTTPDLTAQIMDQIDSGQVKMKPKIYFVLGSILSSLGIGLALVFSLISISILSFRLRKFGLSGLIISGSRPLLAPLPLIILLIGLVIFYLGLRILKKYDFTYRHNFLAITVVILLIVVGLGIFTDQLGFNQWLEKRTGMRQIYQQRQLDTQPNSAAQPRRFKANF